MAASLLQAGRYHAVSGQLEALLASFGKDNAQRGSAALLWALIRERRETCEPPAWSTDRLAMWALRSTTSNRPCHDSFLVSLKFDQSTRLRAKLPPELIETLLLRAKSQGNECIMLAPDNDQQHMVSWVLDQHFTAVKAAQSSI